MSLLPALLLTYGSGPSLLASLLLSYYAPTHLLTALLPRRLGVFEACEPAHVAHAQLAAAAHEQRVVGGVAHCVEHLLAVTWGAMGCDGHGHGWSWSEDRWRGESQHGHADVCMQRGDNQQRAWRGYGEDGDAAGDSLPYSLVAARADDAGAL